MLIDIPKNIQQAETQPIFPAEVSLRGYHPVVHAEDDVLNELVALIRMAKKPMIYCGGGIISGNTFGTGSGVQVIFKTVAYEGDSGGSGKDGADGMSFFLLDGGAKIYDTGAFGGSLRRGSGSLRCGTGKNEAGGGKGEAAEEAHDGRD